MRKLAIASLAALLSSSAAAAPQLVVGRDHSVRLPVGVPVSTVIVGDPAVADVVVVNPRTVLVQGKANGRSEIIALGPSHRPVWQGEVAVVDAPSSRVTLLGGGRSVDYDCAGWGGCAPAVAPPSRGAGQAGGAPSRAASGAPPVRAYVPR